MLELHYSAGISTRSITWITPFVQAMSALATRAPFTWSMPRNSDPASPEISTRTGRDLPLTVVKV